MTDAPKKAQSDIAAGAFEEQRFLNRIDWNLFRQFYDIAQSGSLSGAAKKANKQQPSLSAALKRLEDHLGVVLCRRTPKGIELTPAGRAMLLLCEDMVATVRVAPHVTSQAAMRVEGRLSIFQISNIVNAELDEALVSFHKRHRNVVLEVTIAPWRTVLEALSSNACDVGVTYDSEPRPHFQYEPLFREIQQLYCGPTHPLYGRQFYNPADLAQEGFILTAGDEPEDLERFRKRYNLGSNSICSVEDLHEVSRLIQLGIGIGFLPTIVASSSKKLWPLLAPAILPSYFIYLVGPSPSLISTPAQLFFDETRRRLSARQ
jgi:DNA-binding transcriptional LysR family regulator